jgi:hypothetical protein
MAITQAPSTLNEALFAHNFQAMLKYGTVEARQYFAIINVLERSGLSKYI